MDRNMEAKQDASRAGRQAGRDNFASTELILSYANIVDEVSGFVKLKKAGNNYSGLCPFHSEKTPSFYVNESKGLYYCFGCGKGGNVIGFLKDIRGESFGEVVRYLKQKYNIPLEDTKYYKTNNSQKDEEPLKKILNLSLNFYYENLFVYLSNSRHIIKYLQERGIDENTAKEFKLGFAGHGNGLTKLLSNNKADLDICADAGLLVRKAGPGNQYFDRFTNKLIIPIFDRNNEPIAFASRSVLQDSNGPKYINTNNSAIFIKNNTLFGLNKSLPFIKKENSVIVVEGYFDMITLYSRGIKNVVATMGTALSKNHIITLSRLCDDIILLFDGDKAGINAINRGIELFQGFMDNSDKNIYAVTLSGGDDPDNFARKYGKERLIKLISDNKKSPISFIIDYYMNNLSGEIAEDDNGKNDEALIENNKKYGTLYNEDDIRELKKKIAILTDVAPFIKKIDNNIILSHYINLVSNKLGLKEDIVRDYVSSKKIALIGGDSKDEAGFPVENYEKDLNIQDLAIAKLFYNLPLTDYINDDIINEFSDKDAVYIIKAIKNALDELRGSEASSDFNGGNSRIIEEIISNTENKSKWSRIYYSMPFSSGYNKRSLEDERRDIKRLLIKLKIDNINKACGCLLDELKSGKLDESVRLLKFKELNKLKYLSKELQKKICSF
ncbi:MAG: DNA primase [Deltaproteobacteria bacterium]|nr:DNA primase [Deltaproteobacteria bacterium]MCL5879853.1 DNA primase [Deltaproteobacteria bacterium]MDA8303864.1 DNA primase [Deltaproteobacteria bacterium]